MLLFVVVLIEEWNHEAEMKNKNFKSESAEGCRPKMFWVGFWLY